VRVALFKWQNRLTRLRRFGREFNVRGAAIAPMGQRSTVAKKP
jgi:hypothetical protein